MASGFPGSIDNFTDPLSNSSLSSPSHAGQHADLNDAVEKIETYMGLVKVIPTGATNGTVSADGDVTIGSAVSSVTVSGAFSSLYDNYKILVNGGTASGDAAFSLKLGSSTTGYYQILQYYAYTGTTLSAVNVNNGASFVYVGEGSVTIGAVTGNFDLMNPFRTYRTQIMGFYPASVGGWFSGYHSSATSYSDFTLTAGSGTLTGGTIRVYGYRN